MLALIAGQGELPHRLAERLRPGLVCELEAFPSGLPDALQFRVERLGSFLKTLRKRGATEVCFAGAIRRPKVEATRVDLATMPLVPRMMGAMREGDDALLRTVIAVFEEAGLAVRAAHELLPELLPAAGIPTRAQPGERDRKDAARAAGIVAALGAADVGQACVVARGQALALEAIGGTDWMLASLAEGRRPPGTEGGLLYKAPKPGQDRRIDLPAIGPGTASGAAAAGLSGMVIEADGVMVLGLEETVAACDAQGLFLWIREP